MANDPSAFARDLGYLDKFFVSLTSHADTLPAAQGDRLKQLIAEEVVRWKEIRQLITGQGGAAPSQQPSATTTAKPPAPAPSPSVSVAAQPPSKPQPARESLTVGSLLGQPKK